MRDKLYIVIVPVGIQNFTTTLVNDIEVGGHVLVAVATACCVILLVFCRKGRSYCLFEKMKEMYSKVSVK